MIQKWFYPGKNNNYHPYLLRLPGLALVVLLILFMPLFYNEVSVHQFKLLDYATDINEADLLTLTNQERQANGVAPLTENAELDNAATAKAEDMFAKDYWAHDSPTGETPWDFILAAGYNYSAAAENLAMDFSTSSGVIDGWMNSPEHRTNLLNPVYVDVGMAVMNGTLQGEQTTLVVAEYGAPAASEPPSQQPAQTAPAATAPTSTTPTPPPPATSQPSQPPATPAANPSTTTEQSAPTSSNAQAAAVAKKPPPAKPRMSLVARIESIDSLNWGQKATLYILTVLLLVTILRHTVVWRRQKRGWKHIWLRAHPAFQTSLIIIAMLVVFFSAFGVVA